MVLSKEAKILIVLAVVVGVIGIGLAIFLATRAKRKDGWTTSRIKKEKQSLKKDLTQLATLGCTDIKNKQVYDDCKSVITETVSNFCNCAIDTISEQYTYDEYQTFKKKHPDDLEKAIEKCVTDECQDYISAIFADTFGYLYANSKGKCKTSDQTINMADCTIEYILNNCSDCFDSVITDHTMNNRCEQCIRDIPCNCNSD